MAVYDAGDLEFDIFEAVCGVTGDFGCCGAEAPPGILKFNTDLRERFREFGLPCTRLPGHPGDHVAADVDGSMLAWWPRSKVLPCA